MEINRLADLFNFQLKHYPCNDALAGKVAGQWKKMSTAEVVNQIEAMALGFLDLGLKKGDMVAIMSENCVEWSITDLAIMKAGGISVPIYPTSAEKDVEFICNHCEAKYLFVRGAELWERIGPLRDKLKHVVEVFSFFEAPNVKSWSSLLKPVNEEGIARLKAIENSVNRKDMATIIYTSGTTGDPKGVMLSHDNILTNILATSAILPIHNSHRALTFLPVSHSFERMVLYFYFYTGVSVYFAESIETIGPNLKEVQPHVFTAVPRLLEKMFARILGRADDLKGFKKTLFLWAIDLGLKWEPDGKNGPWYSFKHKIADRLIYSKIRVNIGENALAVASGSAALQPRLARIFNAMGLPIREGYGLTETSPVISVGGFGKGEFKVGTVGRVIAGGKVKIAEDGEILYQGPNVMLGYYKREDLTQEVIDKEGWFHTGDIGVLDDQGFLRITDRKKEMFKTSGGKYIAPQVMENKFKESLFVEQVQVLGEYQKFPAALIVPNIDVCKTWLLEQGEKVQDASREDLIQNSKLVAKFDQELERLNSGFGNWEKVKQFRLVADEWTPLNGLVTPTLKLKRKVILEKYKNLVEDIYKN